MGNRAVITLDKNPSAASVGIYLHWNGGAESVIGFAEAARRLGVRTPESDPEYCLAQLARIIGNFFGEPLSVGVGTLQRLDCDNGDNGLFSLQWDDKSITLRNWPEGDYPGGKFETVNVAKIKETHPYWVNKSGDADFESIVDSIVRKNGATFKREAIA